MHVVEATVAQPAVASEPLDRQLVAVASLLYLAEQQIDLVRGLYDPSEVPALQMQRMQDALKELQAAWDALRPVIFEDVPMW